MLHDKRHTSFTYVRIEGRGLVYFLRNGSDIHEHAQNQATFFKCIFFFI